MDELNQKLSDLSAEYAALFKSVSDKGQDIIAIKSTLASHALLLNALDLRIKELEKARQVQIELNKQFHTHTEPTSKPQEVSTFNIFDFFKRK